MIEVEFRSRFSESEYRRVLNYLTKNANSLGEDDKYVIYYIFPKQLLKLADEKSKKRVKLSLKNSKIGEGSAFPEYEIVFDTKFFEVAKEMLSSLPFEPKKIMEGLQKRHNYSYKGCELAIKYSDVWGYHLEIEKVVERDEDVKDAEKLIRVLAKELGVHLMSDEELREFTTYAESLTK